MEHLLYAGHYYCHLYFYYSFINNSFGLANVCVLVPRQSANLSDPYFCSESRGLERAKFTRLPSQCPVWFCPAKSAAELPFHLSLPEGHPPLPITLQSQQLLRASSFVNGLVKHSAVKRSSLTISIQFL